MLVARRIFILIISFPEFQPLNSSQSLAPPESHVHTTRNRSSFKLARPWLRRSKSDHLVGQSSMRHCINCVIPVLQDDWRSSSEWRTQSSADSRQSVVCRQSKKRLTLASWLTATQLNYRSKRRKHADHCENWCGLDAVFVRPHDTESYVFKSYNLTLTLTLTQTHFLCI